MPPKDYYAILGVERDADGAAIVRACRRLMQRYHPDVCSESNAEARFKQICEAGRILRNPAQRAAYDRIIGVSTRHTMPVRRQRCRSGAEVVRGSDSDVHVDVFLSARELVLGTTLELTLWRSTLRVAVPAHSRAGQVLRVGGHGLLRHDGNRGALLLLLRDTDKIVRSDECAGKTFFSAGVAWSCRRRTGRLVDTFC